MGKRTELLLYAVSRTLDELVAHIAAIEVALGLQANHSNLPEVSEHRQPNR